MKNVCGQYNIVMPLRNTSVKMGTYIVHVVYSIVSITLHLCAEDTISKREKSTGLQSAT